jgi:hypothetical protein
MELAKDALLRSMFDTDVLTNEIRNMSQSDHIRHAYPPVALSNSSSSNGEEVRVMPSYSILPLAIILGSKGSEYSIEKAKEILLNEPNVRKALQQMKE